MSPGVIRSHRGGGRDRIAWLEAAGEEGSGGQGSVDVTRVGGMRVRARRGFEPPPSGRARRIGEQEGSEWDLKVQTRGVSADEAISAYESRGIDKGLGRCENEENPGNRRRKGESASHKASVGLYACVSDEGSPPVFVVLFGGFVAFTAVGNVRTRWHEAVVREGAPVRETDTSIRTLPHSILHVSGVRVGLYRLGLQPVTVFHGSTAGTARPQPVCLDLGDFDSTAGYGTGRPVDTVPVAVRLTASTGPPLVHQVDSDASPTIAQRDSELRKGRAGERAGEVHWLALLGAVKTEDGVAEFRVEAPDTGRAAGRWEEDPELRRGRVRYICIGRCDGSIASEMSVRLASDRGCERAWKADSRRRTKIIIARVLSTAAESTTSRNAGVHSGGRVRADSTRTAVEFLPWFLSLWALAGAGSAILERESDDRGVRRLTLLSKSTHHLMPPKRCVYLVSTGGLGSGVHICFRHAQSIIPE
ncbi:hypothetical protein C8R46DRAFT_1192615 [Mycena filopes]|nr:hypothetical protein C8R46DRAFT_1192615 [Mycena filopes]